MHNVVDILHDDLSSAYGRPTDLTPAQQILMALRFYATGSFQRVAGDLAGISQAATCCTVHRVSRAIARRRRYYIKFPAVTDFPRVKQDFWPSMVFHMLLEPLTAPTLESVILVDNKQADL